MECELCGRQDAKTEAEIEGVRMTVCKGCAGHGKVMNRPAPERQAPRKPRPRPKRKEPEMVEDVHPDVARKLRAYRERKGMTQEEFANRMNIKASVYGHYEAGDRKPSIETARQLEREIGEPLVVHIKVKKGSYGSTESEGMTIGDMLKR